MPPGQLGGEHRASVKAVNRHLRQIQDIQKLRQGVGVPTGLGGFRMQGVRGAVARRIRGDDQEVPLQMLRQGQKGIRTVGRAVQQERRCALPRHQHAYMPAADRDHRLFHHVRPSVGLPNAQLNGRAILRIAISWSSPPGILM